MEKKKRNSNTSCCIMQNVFLLWLNVENSRVVCHSHARLGSLMPGGIDGLRWRPNADLMPLLITYESRQTMGPGNLA